MAKLSETYELMVVLSTKKGEEQVKALVEKFKANIEKNAALTNVDEWGKRKLAYPIEDETEGYYVIFTFNSKTDYPAEAERVLNITDGVLRSMITVAAAK